MLHNPMTPRTSQLSLPLVILLCCISGVCLAQNPTVQVLSNPVAPAMLVGSVISNVKPTYFWTAYMVNSSVVGISLYTRPNSSSIYQPHATFALVSSVTVLTNLNLLPPFCVNDIDINTAYLYIGLTRSAGNGQACMVSYTAPNFAIQACRQGGLIHNVPYDLWPTSISCMSGMNNVATSGAAVSGSSLYFQYNIWPGGVWTSSTVPPFQASTTVKYTANTQIPPTAISNTYLYYTNIDPNFGNLYIATLRFSDGAIGSRGYYLNPYPVVWTIVVPPDDSFLGTLYTRSAGTYFVISDFFAGVHETFVTAPLSGSIGAYAFPGYNGNTFLDAVVVTLPTQDDPSRVIVLTRSVTGAVFTLRPINVTLSNPTQTHSFGYMPTSSSICTGTPNEAIIGAPGKGVLSNPGLIAQLDGLIGFCNQYPTPPVSPPVLPPVPPPVAPPVAPPVSPNPPPPPVFGPNYNLTYYTMASSTCFFTGSVVYALDPLSFWTICALNTTEVLVVQFTRPNTLAPFAVGAILSDTSGSNVTPWPSNANLPPPLHVSVAPDGKTHIFTGFPFSSTQSIHHHVFDGVTFVLNGTATGDGSSTWWPTALTGPTNDPTQIFVSGENDTLSNGTIHWERWSISGGGVLTRTHTLPTYLNSFPGTPYTFPACATNQAFYYLSSDLIISAWNYIAQAVTATINTISPPHGFTTGFIQDIVVANNDTFITTIGMDDFGTGAGGLTLLSYSSLPSVSWTTTTANLSHSASNRNYPYVYTCDSGGNKAMDSMMVAVSNTNNPPLAYLLSRNSSDITSTFSFSSAEIVSVPFPNMNTTAGSFLFGKMITSHMVSGAPQEMIIGAPGDGISGLLGAIVQFQFANFCMANVPPPISPVAPPVVLPPIPPPVTPPPLYYLTLTRPPSGGIAYTEFGLAMAATSDAGGIAVVSRQNNTGQALVTVYKRVAPGAYSILNPPLIGGPLLGDIQNQLPQTLATVRLSDDLNRLAVSTSLAGQPVMYFYYNAAQQQYLNNQNSTGSNIGFGMDMSRDGRTIAYTQDNSTNILRLFSAFTTSSNKPYEFVQNIPIASITTNNMTVVSLDAYGRVLAAAGPTSGVALYRVLPQFDPYEVGYFTLQTVITNAGFLPIFSLKVVGNGSQVWANGNTFLGTPIDSVLVSQYDPITAIWDDFTVEMHGPSAISVSDYGQGVISTDETIGSPTLYSFFLTYDSGTTWTYLFTVPYPPWDVAQVGLQNIELSNTYSLTADCSTIVVSHFLYQTSPPSGDGDVVLYLTEETCQVTPPQPPFTPLPPPVTLPPQVSPIPQGPVSPDIAPNYSPTTPETPPTQKANDLLTGTFVLTLVALVVAIVALAFAIATCTRQMRSTKPKHKKKHWASSTATN